MSNNGFGGLVVDRPILEWVPKREQDLQFFKGLHAMAEREHLPDLRQSITHRFCIGFPGHQYEGYITVGLFDDGRPGELFINAAKAGSVTCGLSLAEQALAALGPRLPAPPEGFLQ